MKIATWNVNSLRARLPHLLQWLVAGQPDLLAIQETKLADEEFPAAELAAAGYSAVCSGQKGYNGVALLSRSEGAREVVTDLPDFVEPQRRVVAGTYAGLRVINVYVPNGSHPGSAKYDYKLAWLSALAEWLEGERVRHPALVLLGDFNIAPEDRDVYDPAVWAGQIMCSGPERAAFARLLALGMVDTLRIHSPAGGIYTWWDYRLGAFRRNRGLRIDHILCSPALAPRCRVSGVDTAPRGWERPSDHAPVVAEFA